MTSREEANDPGHPADEPRPTANLLAPVLGLIGIGALACAVWAFGFNARYFEDERLDCAAIANGAARLACYDQLATHPPARGALAPARTDPQEEMK